MITMITKQTLHMVYFKDDIYRRWNDCTWEGYDTDKDQYYQLDLHECNDLEQQLQKFLKEVQDES